MSFACWIPSCSLDQTAIRRSQGSERVPARTPALFRRSAGRRGWPHTASVRGRGRGGRPRQIQWTRGGEFCPDYYFPPPKLCWERRTVSPGSVLGTMYRGCGDYWLSGGFGSKGRCSCLLTLIRRRGRGRMATGLTWGTASSRSTTFPRGRLFWSGASLSVSDFAGFRVSLPEARAGEPAPRRGLRRASTKEDSKVPSLDSPVWPGGTLCFHVVAICYAGGDRKELESCPYVVFRGSVVLATDY